MSALGNTYRIPDAALYLTHVHDAVYADNLEHSIIMVWLGELFFLVWSPGIGP